MMCDVYGCPNTNKPKEDGSMDTGVLNHFGFLCTPHDTEWQKIATDEELPRGAVPKSRRRYVKYKMDRSADYGKTNTLT